MTIRNIRRLKKTYSMGLHDSLKQTNKSSYEVLICEDGIANAWF